MLASAGRSTVTNARTVTKSFFGLVGSDRNQRVQNAVIHSMGEFGLNVIH